MEWRVAWLQGACAGCWVRRMMVGRLIEVKEDRDLSSVPVPASPPEAAGRVNCNKESETWFSTSSAGAASDRSFLSTGFDDRLG